MTVRNLSHKSIALGVASVLALAACSSSDPAATVEETTAAPPQEQAPESSAPEAEPSVPAPEVVDTGDRTLYAIGMSSGEQGVYSSSDGVTWESVGTFPAGFDAGVMAPGAGEDIAVYSLGDHVATAESGWSDLGVSAYNYQNKDWEITPRAHAAGSWWIASVGVWASDDGAQWQPVQEEFDDFSAFVNGTAADGALPVGVVYGNGNLMLVPRTPERSVPSILRPDDSWTDLAVPVWTSRDGTEWERRTVEFAGEPPAGDAGDLDTDHYTWDGSRWLWQANDALYAAEDTGGPLVFAKVSDIGADGETARSTIAAAGDLVVVPATDAEPASDDDGFIVGGTVLVSNDGGSTWTLAETDVLLTSVEAIAGATS